MFLISFWILLSSICSGFTAAVVSTPADVVKTRIMNQPTDASGRFLVLKLNFVIKLDENVKFKHADLFCILQLGIV